MWGHSVCSIYNTIAMQCHLSKYIFKDIWKHLSPVAAFTWTPNKMIGSWCECEYMHQQLNQNMAMKNCKRNSSKGRNCTSTHHTAFSAGSWFVPLALYFFSSLVQHYWFSFSLLPSSCVFCLPKQFGCCQGGNMPLRRNTPAESR